MILVDTNVLVDIVSDDPLWAEWSQQHLTIAATQDELVINDIVYADPSDKPDPDCETVHTG